MCCRVSVAAPVGLESGHLRVPAPGIPLDGDSRLWVGGIETMILVPRHAVFADGGRKPSIVKDFESSPLQWGRRGVRLVAAEREDLVKTC